MKTTSKLTLFATIACLSGTALVPAADHPAASLSASEALARLKEGNLRFATSEVSQGKPTAARRAETASTQHPFAIIVGCADSRIPPELVFDQNLGTFSSFAPLAIWSTTMPWAVSNTRWRTWARA